MLGERGRMGACGRVLGRGGESGGSGANNCGAEAELRARSVGLNREVGVGEGGVQVDGTVSPKEKRPEAGDVGPEAFDRVHRWGHVDEDEATGGAQDAMDFSEGRANLRSWEHVNRVAGEDGVECVVGVGQSRGCA